MATESNDQIVNKTTVILDTANDWHNWIFVRQDRANRNGLWPYCNPELRPEEVLKLGEPIEPEISTFHTSATKLSDLSKEEKEDYIWQYEKWEKKYTKWETLSKAMRDFESELNETIAKKHLHLLWGKTGPYERLVSLHRFLNRYTFSTKMCGL
jgi:hypothetical protein